MKELIRTNNPALLSYVEALLTEAGHAYFIADRNISIVEGSIGAFPRRVLIAEDEEAAARQLLIEADLGAELKHKK
ncbi:MAG: hypothetical protein A3E78_10070 [Alphaproteobacteria bacterium RIFCSPHIGHO2_12_FULL_63_12]|nr:MAG: hypothetical protein A3E78_10070 [Alphaproteobacteria bacterium RIFCSPHIGHO2_12_FULL_63_12]